MNVSHPSKIFMGVCNPDPYEFKMFLRFPEGFVENIDEEIRREVLPFVRKFESLSGLIRQEAIHLASTISPCDYFDRLSTAWGEHNRLAKSIDTFLHSSIIEGRFHLDSANIAEVYDLLSSALKAERQKRVLSAGVKHLLDKWIELSRTRSGLSSNSMAEVLTVRTPNYWLLYQARHVEFLIESEKRNPTDLEVCLCRDFHASNGLVMAGRLRKERVSKLYPTDLKRMFERYRAIDRPLKGIGLEGEYLAFENPNLRALRSILEYDNFVEYSFGHNLFGIPDLLLRKTVISSLIVQGYLDKREALLLYSDEELLGALKKYEKQRT